MKDFKKEFPSLKDNDYCSFNQIQKDKLLAVCLDKEKVREVIDILIGEVDKIIKPSHQAGKNIKYFLLKLKKELGL